MSDEALLESCSKLSTEPRLFFCRSVSEVRDVEIEEASEVAEGDRVEGKGISPLACLVDCLEGLCEILVTLVRVGREDGQALQHHPFGLTGTQTPVLTLIRSSPQ